MTYSLSHLYLFYTSPIWIVFLFAIPKMGDYINWIDSDNWFKIILSMTPKYDLILRQDGEIKIKQIMAIDINDAIAKGKLERSDLKGVVFSDQNKESSM